MGYAHYWLEDLLFGTTKDAIDMDLISLFTPNDKVILSPPIEMRSPHVPSKRVTLERPNISDYLLRGRDRCCSRST